MPNCIKTLSIWLTAALLLAWPYQTQAEDYHARISAVRMVTDGAAIMTDATIEYRLSPVAREALMKGIAMTWHVEIQLRKPGILWDSLVFRRILPFRLKFHALLNQYEVLTPKGQEEMFLTLNAAIDFMSNLHDRSAVDPELLRNSHLILAIKTRFKRESLPVPLRPFTYLDSQWSLSSDWLLWPIAK